MSGNSKTKSDVNVIANNKITSHHDIVFGSKTENITINNFQYINQSGIMSEIPPSLLPPSAWTRFPEIANKYEALLKQLSILIKNGEYEQSINCYWKILYFTGTRELWHDRAILSNKLLALSIKEKDYKTAGQILAKGNAWPLIYKGNYHMAELFLEKALGYFTKANEYSEMGICYEYLADIYGQTGRLDLVRNNYKEAMKRYKRDNCLKEYQVALKQAFFMQSKMTQILIIVFFH